MNSDSRIPRDSGVSPTPQPSAKGDLRKALAARRRALEPSTRAAWDAAIGTHLLAWCAQHGWPALAVYQALPGEADLSAAYAALLSRGVALMLPVVLEKAAPLAFAAWLPGEAMDKDVMGVAVPASLRLAAAPPALLVPCLGYNGARLRLGYGGGYYDRTLAASPRPATAGIAYTCLAADFAGDPHDIALDVILTEVGTV